MAYTVEIKDYASGAVKEVREGLASEAARRVVGQALTEKVITHFKGLPGNKLGGKRHFWEAAAKSVSLQVTSDGGKVGISQLGVRFRLTGGTIKPVKAKLLTIPARAEVYGRRARDVTGLNFLWGIRDGKPQPIALVSGKEGAATQTASGKRQSLKVGGKAVKAPQGLVMYWLVKSATQAGNANTLPSETELNSTAQAEATKFAERLLERAAKARAAQ